VPVATDAFFAGVLVAESKVHSVTKLLATPLKDMFAAIFFVSVGALMDFSVLPMFKVPSSNFDCHFNISQITSLAQKISIVTSLRSAFCLSSSGGDLALVVAKGTADIGGSTSSFLLPMIGTITIITTFLTPYMVKFSWRLAGTISNYCENRKKFRIV
jgi:K+:H+ antiporter